MNSILFLKNQSHLNLILNFHSSLKVLIIYNLLTLTLIESISSLFLSHSLIKYKSLHVL